MFDWLRPIKLAGRFKVTLPTVAGAIQFGDMNLVEPALVAFGLTAHHPCLTLALRFSWVSRYDPNKLGEVEAAFPRGFVGLIVHSPILPAGA